MCFSLGQFEIVAEHAETALDIWSNFFVRPLFTQSATGREVNAVDSENSKNLTSDLRRRLQVLKALADPHHYYSKFTTGNSQTLPTEDDDKLEFIRHALLDFHRLHYRPEKLTVVVAGPQSLDELESWVVPRFTPMQPKDFPTDRNVMTETERLVYDSAQDCPPLGHDQPEPDFYSPFRSELQDEKWPVLVTTKPIKSVRRMVMMFPLPPTEKHPDQSPTSILSHLLGHEGPGSSFAVLQTAGLISSLSTGTGASGPDFTLFEIDIGLTSEGEERWKEVADVIFQHCRLIQKSAEEAQRGKSRELYRIWGESVALRQIFFHQASPGQVYSFAPDLSRRVVTHGTEKCVSAGSMLDETEETLPLDRVVDFASRLVVSNCFIERCSDGAWAEMEELEKQGNPKVSRRTEPWYGVDFFLSEIDAENTLRWDGQKPSLLDASKHLSLPSPNRYIPRSLELCNDLPEEARLGPRIEKEIDPPKLIVENPAVGRLWHRLDDRYALPKAVITLIIRNAAIQNVKKDGVWQFDMEAAIQSSLLTSIFSSALAQEVYDADLAGLKWHVSTTSSGIEMSCRGFSDRLPDLALKILEDFLSGSFVQEPYFSSTKDRKVRHLKSFFESQRADSSAGYYRDFLLTSQRLGLDISLAITEATTLESAKKIHANLLANEEWIVDCLYTGNVSESEAKEFFTSASQIISNSLAKSTTGKQELSWTPGELERRLIPGEDVELHFSSQNTSEENGSVIVTFQSSVPGYRGDGLSSDESLLSSASIRLISQILREPFYDELRTKQTLGYVVSSYYDMGISSTPAWDYQKGPSTVPVDFLVLSVLSRKLAPSDVLSRMDAFLLDFRKLLVSMPESEIQHHASSLSTQMLKPIRELGTEASIHFAKIKRFSPQLSGGNLPWRSAETLARRIETLKRDDLLQTWDRLVLPRSRARIVTQVYGSTFPLDMSRIAKSGTVVVDNVADIVALRNRFPAFTNAPAAPTPKSIAAFLAYGLPTPLLVPSWTLGMVAAVSVMGAGALGFSLLNRSRKATT